jgi:hypothetical protein
MGSQLVDKKYRRHFGRDLKAASPEKIQVQWSLILLALGAFGLSARDWSLEGIGWGETVFVPVLAALCLTPAFLWYRNGMDWLPLGEAFLGMTFVFYGFPSLYGNLDWLAISPEQRFMTLAAVVVFAVSFLLAYRYWAAVVVALMSFLLAYRSDSGDREKAPQQDGTRGDDVRVKWMLGRGVMTILKREIRSEFIWLIFLTWVASNVIIETGLLPDMGDKMNVFNSVFGAGGSMSIVYLCYQLGLRQLSAPAHFVLITGLIAGLATNIASGFLVQGAGIMAAALFAFSLGRKRVPALTATFCMVLLGVLHVGKDEYRITYWDEGKNFGTHYDISLVTKYTTWFEASWKAINRDRSRNDDQTDLFVRASLLQVLATVMQETPVKLPYLNGLTYEILPDMLTPRPFWSDKPRGSLPTEFLAVHYGLQAREEVDFTSVSVGSIAEGWANFGWFGVAGAGLFYGAFFSIPARLSRSLVPRQIGWLLSSIFLVYSVDVAHTVVEVFCSVFQGLLMGLLILTVLSRGFTFSRLAKKHVPSINGKYPQP